MTTLRRCPVCRHTVSSDDCTHCPECSAALAPERPAADRSVHDILKNVKHQIDACDDDAEEPGSLDRDVAQILSGSDFQSLMDESGNDGEDMPEDDASGEPRSWAAARPDAPGDGIANEAPSDQWQQRPSPFGAALGSLKQKPAAPEAEQAQGGPDIWDRYAFLLDDGPDSAGADTPSAPGALKSRSWWGTTRQILYLLLIVLACIAVFRLFAPKEKKRTADVFVQPGKTDIEFLDAIEYLEEYYEQHPELKHGKAVPRATAEPDESGAASRFMDGPERDEPARAPENPAGSAP